MVLDSTGVERKKQSNLKLPVREMEAAEDNQLRRGSGRFLNR